MRHFDPDKTVIFGTIIGGKVRLPYIARENCHEDPDYRIGCHCDPRNIRGREDPAKQGCSHPIQQLLSHNSVSQNPVAQRNDSSSYCHFRNGETDPDPRVRLQLLRDCKHDEDAE